MANNVGNEHPSRPPIGLLTSVLLLGTLLAWWGTRDDRQSFGEALRRPVTAASVVVPEVTQDESALVDRGYQISQRQCAGCHEMTARSSAPSYQEIVTFYRRGFSTTAGNPDLRSRLASAVTHPQPEWGNFAPGPRESGLSPEDRTAVASWMLNSFDREKNADKGAGQ
ncbi:MAG: cytochrome c [Terriglobales bacterium]